MDDKENFPNGKHGEHPLDSPQVLAVIAQYAPKYIELLQKAERPKVSSQPDELELWEADQIANRQGQLTYETNFGYTLRILYEELFSVNQSPGIDKTFEESAGHTVGGMLSHFSTFHTSNGVSIFSAKEWDLYGESMIDVLLNQKGESPQEIYAKRKRILDMAQRITYPDGLSEYLRMMGKPMIDFLRNPNPTMLRKDIDTYGLRLLQLVRFVPEVTEVVNDDLIRDMCGVKPTRGDLPKIEAVRMLWMRLSRKALTDSGTYRDERDPLATEALRELLFIRTHPEFQFLFEYRSPSGYINDLAVQEIL